MPSSTTPESLVVRRTPTTALSIWTGGRDWRINAADVTIEERVAMGSEGEVWRGTLRAGCRGATATETVAVKLATGLAATWTQGKPVWSEAEVAAMMLMQV